MRIGIDYTPAAHQGGGIGRYTRELVRALAELDHENEYILFQAAWGSRWRAIDWPPNFRIRQLPVSDRWLTVIWQRLRVPLPVELFTGPIDLFYSPDYVLPPRRSCQGVVTVHDLSFVTVPQTTAPGLRNYLLQAVPRALAQADHVLADSQSTRDDLIDYLGVERERITVIYPGVEARFQPLNDPALISTVRAKYGLDQPFILALGTLQPRKNYTSLIEAFAQLQPPSHPVTQPPILAIAGDRGWLYDAIFETVDRLSLGDRVRFLGFVPDQDLPVLYNAAEMFVFPSLYEGFGLPPLEAMACGTPVIASNVSSLPEVVGDAGLLVPPQDVKALARAMERVLVDQELRGHFRTRGLTQARRFTWTAAAKTLLEVCRLLNLNLARRPGQC